MGDITETMLKIFRSFKKNDNTANDTDIESSTNLPASQRELYELMTSVDKHLLAKLLAMFQCMIEDMCLTAVGIDTGFNPHDYRNSNTFKKLAEKWEEAMDNKTGDLKIYGIFPDGCYSQIRMTKEVSRQLRLYKAYLHDKEYGKSESGDDNQDRT